ncbi:MAG: transposase, partial [Gammaproteobacteria bacterium]|nr:transposase [Gammaproteobacteria bacterium]
MTMFRAANDLDAEYVVEVVKHQISEKPGGKAMTIAETLEQRGFEKGKTEGITEGITKGETKGKTKGITEATETMALNLFGEGMSLDFVARVT